MTSEGVAAAKFCWKAQVRTRVLESPKANFGMLLVSGLCTDRWFDIITHL